MSKLQLRSRPAATPSQDIDSAPDLVMDEANLAPMASSTTGTSAFASRAMVYVLGAAILCGPAGVALAVTRQQPPAAAAGVADSPDRDARRAAAQEVGVQWTRAYLSTPAALVARLSTYWSGAALTLPASAAAVSDAVALDAVATAPGVWSVTVALDVTPAGGVVQRRYFQVPVAVAGGAGASGAQAKPLTVPAEISGPGAADLPTLTYSSTVPSSGAAGAAVHGFLAALLAGTGDLTRWSAPGLNVTPVTPPPYGDVQVMQLQADTDAAGLSTGVPADGKVVHLLATVMMRLTAAVDGQADAFRTGQYLLSVTARAGRWEVSGMDNSPAMTSSSPAPAAVGQPSSAPTPASGPAGPAGAAGSTGSLGSTQTPARAAPATPTATPTATLTATPTATRTP